MSVGCSGVVQMNNLDRRCRDRLMSLFGGEEGGAGGCSTKRKRQPLDHGGG
jgi:hypothetical protein